MIKDNLSLENIKDEIWKDVVGWEELYQVSNLGRVKTKHRVIYYDRNLGCGIEPKTIYPRIRKQKMNKHTGYYMVGLNGKGKPKNITVHSMVAKAFIRDYTGKDVVNHKDGIKTNNILDNLEVVTYTENLIHSFKMRLNKSCHPVMYNGKEYCSKSELRRVEKIPEKRMSAMINSGKIVLLDK